MKRLIFWSTFALSIAAVIVFLATHRIWSYAGVERACKANTQKYLATKGLVLTEWQPYMFEQLGDDGPINLMGKLRIGQRQFNFGCTGHYGDSNDNVTYGIEEQQ